MFEKVNNHLLTLKRKRLKLELCLIFNGSLLELPKGKHHPTLYFNVLFKVGDRQNMYSIERLPPHPLFGLTPTSNDR